MLEYVLRVEMKSEVELDQEKIELLEEFGNSSPYFEE